MEQVDRGAWMAMAMEVAGRGAAWFLSVWSVAVTVLKFFVFNFK